MERNRCHREPWNTAAGSAASEDMPRKSLDIRFTDHPFVLEKGRPFSCFRRGRVRAAPGNSSLHCFLAEFAVFKVRFRPFSKTCCFHRSFDTTLFFLYLNHYYNIKNRFGIYLLYRQAFSSRLLYQDRCSAVSVTKALKQQKAAMVPHSQKAGFGTRKIKQKSR